MNNIMTEKKCSKPIIVLLLLTTIAVGVATLLGVKKEKALAKENAGVSTKDIVYDSTAVNRDELRTGRLAKYFEYPGNEGLIVFAFEDAKDEFRFGLRPGSNVYWSQQEISEIARERCNLEEMKAILSTYDVPKDKVRCLLTFNPSSSYLGGELSAHRDSLETEEFLKRMIFGSNE